MPLYRHPVGERIYVWSQSKGGKTRGVSHAAITAHGVEAVMTGMEVAPECKLVFYCPHGSNLGANPIEKTLSFNQSPVETIPSRQSQNYRLTKYTDSKEGDGRNNQGETYAALRRMDNFFSNAASDYARYVQEAENFANEKGIDLTINGYFQRGYRQSLHNRESYSSLKMDIITIRNRKGKEGGILLSELLKNLAKEHYSYTHLHCVFCRGRQILNPWENENPLYPQKNIIPEGTF